MLAVDQAASAWRSSPRRVSLIGHSHVALYFSDGAAAGATGGQAPDGHEIDLTEGRWLLNPGSVGQPRDGDPRAAWLELDTEAWKATYHRVEYEIDARGRARSATPGSPTCSPTGSTSGNECARCSGRKAGS